MKLNLNKDSIKRYFYAAVSVVLVTVLVFAVVSSIPDNALVYAVLNGMPTDGSADESARFELVLDGTDIKLYARNCIGLQSSDMTFEYDSSVITAVHAVAGKDAEYVNNNIKYNSFTFEHNPNVAGKILLGFYFKENLWSSEEFALLDESEDCEIDSENFHLLTIKFILADGMTASDIEMSFTANANFVNAQNISCPCIGIEKGEYVSPEETTAPYEEETTGAPDAPSVDSARYELVLDGTEVKLYARNCIGLQTAEMTFEYDSSVITAVNIKLGEDAEFLSPSKINGNSLIAAWNPIENAEKIRCVIVFSEYLWSSEKFAAADISGECEIDSENFHLLTFDLTLASGMTARDIEMSFTSNSNFINAENISCPCIGIKKSVNVPSEEETTAPPEESTTHTHKYSLVSTKKATCTALGKKTYKCSCGDSYTESVPSLGGHKLTWVETKAATSFTKGEKTGKCSNCDYTEKKAIEKLLEIAVKPEANDKIKISAKEEMLVLAGNNVEVLLKNVPENTKILDINGKEVKKDAPIATGMQIVLKDKNGKTVDTQTIVVLCDVDGDGDVSAIDARKTLRAAVSLETLKDCQKAAADVEQNNKQDASDARKILRTAVELENIKELFAKIK